jgi:hypothetical protein
MHMETLGKELIISGFALMAVAQMTAPIIAFRASFTGGLCSLTIPGYLLVAMRRAGYYWKFFAAWGGGVLAVIVGTLALSG